MTLLLQHPLRHHALHCYSIYNVPMILTTTAYIMSLWSLSLQHHLCRYVPIATNNYYVFMISIITTSTTSQRSPFLQHLICRNVSLYTRPHGFTSMLSNEQPLIPDYGSRPTLPKLPREPKGCARARKKNRRHAYGCYILYFCHLHTGL